MSAWELKKTRRLIQKPGKVGEKNRRENKWEKRRKKEWKRWIVEERKESKG